jgi:hypothetical protein
VKWLLLIPLVAGCATMTRYAHWPYQGPMLKVTNSTPRHRLISVRDGAGRELVKARLAPGRSLCFRWPFIDGVGHMIAAGSDTLSTGRFEPWTADGWVWDVAREPVADPSVCR